MRHGVREEKKQGPVPIGEQASSVELTEVQWRCPQGLRVKGLDFQTVVTETCLKIPEQGSVMDRAKF